MKPKSKIFCYDSSKADERYFRNALVEWIKKGEPENLHRTLWAMLYERNGKGKTTKYLYFNEHSQRLYIDRDFMEWAKGAANEIRNVLEKVNG